MAGDRKLFGGLTKSPDEIRAEHLREWASSVAGTTPISEVTPRNRARIAGVIQKIRIDPREGRDSIEATIIDGTGRMKVKWLGRQSMSGISLGMGLVVEGTIGGSQKDLTILNPEYRLVPGAEHG
ncbi:MAG: hypothetical protein M3290_10545 [Actinomycetota bacterium]|nr:hypothetical protein [Actinomycetota bacterium]